ncbi:hypothetical protein [Nocardioides sp. TF02-7]|uniref:hypothetical protein n=1 Tax=Nocardioides sp. TF02-7 TaxID=2917724 RepID=UPI001F0648FE|nr:hypothetical protein [Nocardioides sp. TF02-7]UMG95004.1 hypothetical protein MF408_05000 [Nocardioides sp. TF02-7]
MARAVAGGLGVGEVLLAGHDLGEVGVLAVDAGVEHGDRDAAAVEPGLPRGGGADLRHALVEGHLDPAVEPDLVDVAERGGALPPAVDRRGEAGQPVAEGVRALLVELDADTVDALQPHGDVGGRHVGLRAVAVGHDQRQLLDRRVVVALLDQPGHVEQLGVEPLRHQGLHVVGHDEQVVAALDGEEAGRGAGRRGDVIRTPSAGVLGHRHHVAGHQGDLLRAARGGSGGCCRPCRPCRRGSPGGRVAAGRWRGGRGERRTRVTAAAERHARVRRIGEV